MANGLHAPAPLPCRASWRTPRAPPTTYENGIHGLPVKWDTGEKIWGGLIGQPATFGCAMLDDEDAKTLYDLAYLGMPVYIEP
jgi:hypothetical protein